MAFTIQTLDLKRAVQYFECHDQSDIILLEHPSYLELRPVADPTRFLIIRPKDSAVADKVEVTERRALGKDPFGDE